jgi:hypothetical protein
MLRWECRHHPPDRYNRASTHLPFGYGVSALLHRSSDYGVFDNSLALVLLLFLWVVCPRKAARIRPFMPCLRRVGYLLPPRAESETPVM